MAIFLFTAPFGGIRGKLGGLVFSANKAGPFVKSWGKGANPRTTSQTGQRQVLTAFAQSWKALTAGERTGWDTYAALAAQDKTNSLGETYSISGFNWYVAINSTLVRAGQAARTAAPVTATPAQPTILALRLNDEDDGLDSVVQLTVGSSGLTDILFVRGRVTMNIGTATITVGSTFLEALVPNASRQVFFQSGINEKFGTIQVGQQLFCEVLTMNNHGRLGPIDAKTTLKT